MNIRFNMFFMAGIFGAVSISVAQSGQRQSSQVPKSTQAVFSIAISMPRYVVKVGTEVPPVSIDITNTSNREFRLNSSNGTHEMQNIVIRDDQGNSPLSKVGRDIAAGRDWLVGSEHSLAIEAGKTVTERVAVPLTYDLSQPGKYTIQVKNVTRTAKPS